MIGMAITFRKLMKVGEDAMRNPLLQATDIVVDDCLIAPITEPANAREQQAIDQAKDQVRIHIPKAFDGDVSNSFVEWGNRVFKVDSDSVPFMNENTPTRWNRYTRGESIGGGTLEEFDLIGYFITEDSESYLQQESA